MFQTQLTSSKAFFKSNYTTQFLVSLSGIYNPWPCEHYAIYSYLQLNHIGLGASTLENTKKPHDQLKKTIHYQQIKGTTMSYPHIN